MIWLSPSKDFCKRQTENHKHGVHPVEQSLCSVSLQTNTDIGSFWVSSSNYPLKSDDVEIKIGNGETPLNIVIEQCLLTLKAGESCEILIKADGSEFEDKEFPKSDADDVSVKNSNHGSFLDETSPKKPRGDDRISPTPQTCRVNITLKSIIKQSLNIFEFSEDEKLSLAKDYKEKGTNLYKSAQYKYAFILFSKSLKYLICMGKTEDLSELVAKEHKLLKTQCYLNLSACQALKENNSGVIHNCTKALELDPDNVKGLFRRGQAFLKNHEYEKSREDLLKANKLEPGNKSIEKLLSSVQEKTKVQEQKLANAMSKMFK